MTKENMNIHTHLPPHSTMNKDSGNATNRRSLLRMQPLRMLKAVMTLLNPALLNPALLNPALLNPALLSKVLVLMPLFFVLLPLSAALHAQSDETQTVSGDVVYRASSELQWQLFSNTADAAARGTSFSGVDIVDGSLTIESGASLRVVFNGPGSDVDWSNATWNQNREWLIVQPTGSTPADFSSAGSFTLVSDSLDSTSEKLNGVRARRYDELSTETRAGGVYLRYRALTGSLANSTLEADTPQIVADGTSKATLTIRLVNAGGENIPVSNGVVTLSTDLGSFTGGTDNGSGGSTVTPVSSGDGTFTAELTQLGNPGTATITAFYDGDQITQTTQVEILSAEADLDNSIVALGRSSLISNGTDTTLISIQLVDAFGNLLTLSDGTITFDTIGDLQGTVGPVTDNNDGTYEAIYTAGTKAGPLTIIPKLDRGDGNGAQAFTNTAELLTKADQVETLLVLLPGETEAPGTTPFDDPTPGTGKTGTPSDITAGIPLTLDLKAVDNYWNIDSTATPLVGVTSSDASAVLPPAATLVEGETTFTITLNTVGSQTLIFADNSDSSVNGSVTVDVKVNPASLQVFADLVPADLGTAGAPTFENYLQIGVSGITEAAGQDPGNVPAVNSVLASLPSADRDEAAEIQAIADVLNQIHTAADGDADAGSAATVDAAGYARIGLTDMNTPAEISLLNDLFGTLLYTGTDTIEDLKAYASLVGRVMATAVKTQTDPVAVVPPLTPASFDSLGITGVNATNLSVILGGIASTPSNSNDPDDGAETDTMAELQALVNSLDPSPILTINQYLEGTSTGADIPTAQTYTDAGITGVDVDNLDAINSIISTLDSDQRNTTVKIQNAVNTYNSMLGIVNGNANTAALEEDNFVAIGLESINNTAEINLMNSMLDSGLAPEDIDTFTELEDLASVVERIILTASGSTGNAATVSPALTPADFAAIGLTGITAGNLSYAIGQIEATATDGSEVDSIAELQAMVNSFTDTRLTAINLLPAGAGTFSPAFHADSTTFTAELPEPFEAPLTFEPVLSQSNAMISGLQNPNDLTAQFGSGPAYEFSNLIPGPNTATFTVTAQDGSTTTDYTFIVKKLFEEAGGDEDSNLAVAVNDDTVQLLKTGAGTTTVTANSNYGEVNVGSGTIVMGDGSTDGSIGNAAIAVSDGALFAIDRSDDLTFNNEMSGNGGFEQRGSGTVTFENAKSYKGGTTVTAGTLKLDPAGDIGGGGIITGSLTIASGAFVEAAGTDVFGYLNDRFINTLNLNGGTLTHTAPNHFWVTGDSVRINMTGGVMELAGDASGSGGNDFLQPVIAIGADANPSVIRRRTGNTTATLRLRNDTDLTVDAADGGILRIDVPIYSSDGSSGTSGARPGGLRKKGAGLLHLTETSLYTGATEVRAGELRVDGDLRASSLLTVSAGARLSGIGLMASSLVKGIHAPGASPGIQTVEGDLTYDASSILEFELAALTTDSQDRGIKYDGVNVKDGSLNITAGASVNLLFDGTDANNTASTVDWTDSFWDEDQEWLLIKPEGTTVIDSDQVGSFVIGSVGNDINGNSLNGTTNREDDYFDVETRADGVWLRFVSATISADKSTLAASQSSIKAGESQSELTVTLYNPAGNRIYVTGADLFLDTDLGTVGVITDVGSSGGSGSSAGAGTYTAVFTSTTAGTATIDAYLGTSSADPKIGSVTIMVEAGAVAKLTLNEPADLLAGERAAYTVIRRDANDNAASPGALQPVFLTSTGLAGTFYDSATGGNAVTSVDIAGGASSVDFWFRADSAGTFTITASDASPADDASGLADAADVVNVSPAAVSKLQVLMAGEQPHPGTATGKSGTPTPLEAGTQTTLTLRAVDAFWNLVTSAAPTVSLTSSDNNAQLPPPVSLTAGTAQAAITLNTSGNQTVTATDQEPTTPLTAHTGSSVPVLPGAPTQLAFVTEPAGTTIGESVGAVQVELLDAQGNRVTADNSTQVDLTIQTNPGSAVFLDEDGEAAGSSQTATASSGLATFPPLSLHRTGTDYELAAAATGLAGAVSAKFTMTARSLTVTGSFDAQDKIYDGATAAVVQTDNLALSGVLAPDAASGGNPAAVSLAPVLIFAQSDAGTNLSVTLDAASSLTGTAASNYTLDLSGSPVSTASINPKKLTITGLTGDDKVYDQTTNATASGTATLSGILSTGTPAAPDDVALSGTPVYTFAQADAGTVITITTTGYTLTGADLANYELTQPELTADINPKPVTELTLTGLETLTYNGNAQVQTGITLTDGSVQLQEGGTEDFTIAYAFNTNASDTAKITVSGVNNYGSSRDTTFIILPKTITASSTVASKVYDGSATTGAVTLGQVTGYAGSETLVITPSADNFADANTGSGKATVIRYTLADGSNGGLASNYRMEDLAVTGEITARPLTISAVTDTKVYDGTTASGETPVVTSGQLVNGHTGSFTQVFTDSAAAAGKTINPTGTITDTNTTDVTANYDLTFAPVTDGEITAKELTLDGNFTAEDKSYDGTTDAVIETNNLTLTGVLPKDTVSLDSPVAVFADANAAQGISVSISSANLAGAQAANYTLSLDGAPVTTADITFKQLTVSAPSITKSKVYDGTTEAAVTAGTLSGVQPGQTVTVSAEAAYDQADAGTGKTITVVYTLDGADKDNYEAPVDHIVSDGVITQAPLVASSSVADKVYDGTAQTGAVTLGDVTGYALTTDTLSITAVADDFADLNVGTGKATTIRYTLTDGNKGGKAANYSMAPLSATASITARTLTITPDAGQSKVYGAADPTITFRTSNEVAGEVPAFSGALSRDAGETVADYDILAGNLALKDSVGGNFLAANYSLSVTAGETFEITHAPLTVTAKDMTKSQGEALTFDGTEFEVQGLIQGDDVASVTLTSAGTAAGADVGTYPIIPSDAQGTGLVNYSVTYANGTLLVEDDSAPVLTLTAPDSGADLQDDGQGGYTLAIDTIVGDRDLAVLSAADYTAVSWQLLEMTGRTDLQHFTITDHQDADKQQQTAALAFNADVAPGTYQVELCVTDGFTNSVCVEVTVVITPGPAAEITTLAAASEFLALDASTQLSAVVQDAFGYPVEGVTVYFSSSHTDRATVPASALSGPDGTFSTTATGAGQASGVVTITAEIRDTDANVASNDAKTADLTMLGLPEVTVKDLFTTNDTPVITGTSSAVDTSAVYVTVSINQKQYQVLQDGNGEWSLTLPQADALADSLWPVSATVTDLAGNTVQGIGEVLVHTIPQETGLYLYLSATETDTLFNPSNGDGVIPQTILDGGYNNGLNDFVTVTRQVNGSPVTEEDDFSYEQIRMTYDIVPSSQYDVGFQSAEFVVYYDAAMLDFVQADEGTLFTETGPNSAGFQYTEEPAVTVQGIQTGVVRINIAQFGPGNVSVKNNDKALASLTFEMIKPGEGLLYIQEETMIVYDEFTTQFTNPNSHENRTDLELAATDRTKGMVRLWPGDFTGDSHVNFSDLTHFASAYFSTPDEPAYRIKYDIGATQVTNYYSLPVSDGEIGFRDLITFATGYTLSNERSQPASLQETPVQATLTELERQNGKHLYELSLGGVQADLRAFSLTLQGGKVRDLIPQNALETDLTFLMHGVIGDSDSTKVDVGLIGKGDAVGYDQTVLQIVTDGRVNLIESVFADEFGHLIHAEVSVEELPDEFDLYQNYPNPFNPATTIRYDLPENTDVRLEIFNILGQRVYTLVDAPQKAGRYEVRFDAGRMASGVYFYRLRTGAFASVKQMTLIK